MLSVASLAHAQASLQGWTKIAKEGQEFRISGSRIVRYGVDGKFVDRTISGRAKCDNATFSDPIVGVVKGCHVQTDLVARASANAFSGPEVSIPTVKRVEVVASDARPGDRGDGWGGHQPRYVVHDDGVERLLYIRGDLSGPGRNWRLMRRAPNGGWAQEATGQTDSDAFLMREPITDTAHIVSFPNQTPTVHSQSGFLPVRIPGSWPTQANAYQGAGIGPSGALVIKTQFDQKLNNVDTQTTETHYGAGQLVGFTWEFNPVVKKYIGERYAYDFILPGAWGNPAEFADVSLRDILKGVAGFPGLNVSYVFDGVRQVRTGLSDSQGWAQVDLIPKRSIVVDGAITHMAGQDVFADSKGRLLSLYRIADPGKDVASFVFLTASDAAGNRLGPQIKLDLGGNLRFYEDAKNRLWLLQIVSGTVPWVRLHRLRDDLSIASTVDLSKAFPSLGYDGFVHLATPRGGNTLGDTITGAYPAGSKVVAFSIRLPNN